MLYSLSAAKLRSSIGLSSVPYLLVLLIRMLGHRAHWDNVYQSLLVLPSLWLAQKVLMQTLDAGVLAFLGSYGLSKLYLSLTVALHPMYRGLLMVHVLAIMIGSALILVLNVLLM